MFTRRSFLAASAALAAPAILPFSAYAQSMRIRRDVQAMSLTDPFFEDYAQAVTAMHQHDDDGSSPFGWRAHALTHIRFCPHGAPDFLAWHRHYIRRFEATCAKLIGKPDFALPYWNWTRNRGRIPDPLYTDARLAPNALNDPSNARAPNWRNNAWVRTTGRRSLRRGTGLADVSGGSAFTEANINGIKSSTDFGTFQRRIEGTPHSLGHTRVGGHMTSGMSPLDPIFWLHHANVDRIWAEWQALGNVSRSGGRRYENQFFDADGNSVTDLEDDARDYQALGFSYDTLLGAAGPMAALGAGETPESRFAAVAQDLSLPEAGVPARVLGQRDVSIDTGALQPVRITVPAPDIAKELFTSRMFLAPAGAAGSRVAVENRRIMAEIGDVMANAAATSLAVRVFVNFPGVTPDTPDTDPHYAGVFGLFGVGPGRLKTSAAGASRDNASQNDEDAPREGASGAAGAEKEGGMEHDMAGMHSYPIDITEPLRRQAAAGDIPGDEITIQLVPIPAGYRSPRAAVLHIGKVEISSV